MHLCLSGFETLFVRPYLPGEDDLLPGIGIHGAAKVGLFALGNIILPSFDNLETSIILEEARGSLRR